MAVDTNAQNLITNNVTNATSGNLITNTELAAILNRLNLKANDSQIPSVSNFLNQTQVDARVVAGTAAEARNGNTDRWDKDKVPSDTVYDADIADFQTDTEVNALIANANTGFKTTNQTVTTIADANLFGIFVGGSRRLVSWATIKTLLASTPDPTPTYTAPTISTYSIGGLDPANMPAAGSNLGGSRVVSYTITNSQNVQGNLEIDYRVGTGQWTPIAITIDPGQTSATIDFGTITAQAGQTYQFRLTGIDTQGNAITPSILSITVASARPQDNVYLNYQDVSDITGTTAAARAAQFSTTGATTAVFSAQPQTLNVPTITDANSTGYVMYAQRNSDPNVTNISISGLNSTGNFERVPNAVTIGGVQYDVWISTNVLRGTIVSGNAITFTK